MKSDRIKPIRRRLTFHFNFICVFATSCILRKYHLTRSRMRESRSECVCVCVHSSWCVVMLCATSQTFVCLLARLLQQPLLFVSLFAKTLSRSRRVARRIWNPHSVAMGDVLTNSVDVKSNESVCVCIDCRAANASASCKIRQLGDIGFPRECMTRENRMRTAAHTCRLGSSMRVRVLIIGTAHTRARARARPAELTSFCGRCSYAEHTTSIRMLNMYK